MATLQNIGKLKYRGKDGQWHPLPVVVQDTGGGVSTISGKGAPTSDTQGKVNQLYRDEDTQRLYICTATDGGYTWAEVSGGTGGSGGGSVDVDATLTKAGQAAGAKAAGDAIGKKIDKAQGTGNAGKILGIGADGNVTPQDKPVQALAGSAAPTTATVGVVAQEYYVIVGNAVTEMYVCTAVENGTYTWGKVEFGAEETDPTVPAWAKAAQKPSYTASEVGADPSGTAASQVSAHNTGTDTHSDIRLLISGLTDRLNALADSDDTTLDQLSEVVAYIKSNRTLIESITTNKVNVADIIDNLTTNVANKPLSAAQGVALKALIDGIVVPDKLPNPNALTFTGAAAGSYDGSAPLSVEIPSGGGGSGASESWKLIRTINIVSGTSSYSFDTDNNGNTFKVKNFLILIDAYPAASGYLEIKPNGNFSFVQRPAGKQNYPFSFMMKRLTDMRYILENSISNQSTFERKISGEYSSFGEFTSFSFWFSAGAGSGTTMYILGEDV